MVYLLHFDAPIGNDNHKCQHYLGWTNDLNQRIAKHERGKGAKLTRWAMNHGISFQVVRLWEGEYPEEKRLKAIHGNRLCPICNPDNTRGQALEEIPLCNSD
jgi:hypothetical protein